LTRFFAFFVLSPRGRAGTAGGLTGRRGLARRSARRCSFSAVGALALRGCCSRFLLLCGGGGLALGFYGLAVRGDRFRLLLNRFGRILDWRRLLSRRFLLSLYGRFRLRLSRFLSNRSRRLCRRCGRRFSFWSFRCSSLSLRGGLSRG